VDTLGIMRAVARQRRARRIYRTHCARLRHLTQELNGVKIYATE